MIGRGLFILTLLSSCVLSLPVTPSQLENEDVKVMKCIVEALADVLSRPHPMPVSQECLVTLKTDDRLVTILRHHNFLKELQEIAVQGGQERAQLPRDTGILDHVTQTPQTTGDAADRSMLEALGGPGERSILSQNKRRTGNGDGEEEKGDGESRENIRGEVQAKRGNHENLGSHISESVDDWSQGKAEKRGEEDEEEYEERRENSDENSEEENMIKDKKGAGSDEKRDATRSKTKEKKFDDEDEEEKGKRPAHFSHKQEDGGETKRGSTESLRLWTKRAKGLTSKTEAQELSSRQEVPHHSKEVTEEDEVKTKKSPEEKELQMIAGRAPEEKRGLEEEGSASRKSEEPEIESLAAIESELENVAQKLHKMRRG